MGTAISIIAGFSIAEIVAQENQDNGIKLSISPLPISISSPPSSTVTYDLRIRNSGNKVETLAPDLLTFTSANDTGEPQLHTRTPKDEYLDWISFSPDKLELQPQEWGTSRMTITIPEQAAYGYYFAVTWGRSATVVRSQTAANLEGSVAQLVLLEVPAPGGRKELSLDRFTTNHRWVEFLPVTFEANLRNTGNIHTLPFGNIFISKGDNPPIATLELNKERGYILPDSQRTYSIDWKDGFPAYTEQIENGSAVLDEHGRPVHQLNWDLSHAEWWRFGKYDAKIVLAYDRDGQDIPITAQTSFWIIPWRLILAAIAIPLLPTLLMYLFMRWRNSPQVDDH